MLSDGAFRLRPFRGGFTLVEVVIAAAILGVLAALLLPAIQAARAASRQATCQARLHEIGLAIAQHEAAHRRFPIGCIGCRFAPVSPDQPPPPQRFLSWNIQILPFMEEGDLASRFDFGRASYQSPNRELGAAVLRTFLCPGTPDEVRHNDSGLWKGMAFGDFAGIYGVEGEGRTNPDPTSPHWLNTASLGALLYEHAVSAHEIEDGLSHSALVAEVILRRVTETEWASGQNVFAQEGSTPINYSSGLGNEIGSPHAGGASVVFCDGHVEFLHEAIDQHALNALLTKAGDEEVIR